MDKNKMIFSDKLRRIMAMHNKNRYDLSEDLHISYTTLCDWVNGKTIPRSKKLDLLADYFGVGVSYFFEDDEKMEMDNCESNLQKAIEVYSSNNYQKELLIKATMLNLDNTKKAIENVDFYLYKQEQEENTFKWLDKFDNKYYDK